MWTRLLLLFVAVTATILTSNTILHLSDRQAIFFGGIPLPCLPTNDDSDDDDDDDNGTDDVTPSICSAGGIELVDGEASAPITLESGTAQNFCVAGLSDDTVSCTVTAASRQDLLRLTIEDEDGVICENDDGDSERKVCTVSMKGDELVAQVGVGAGTASNVVVTCAVNGTAGCVYEEIVDATPTDPEDLLFADVRRYCLPISMNSGVTCTSTANVGQVTLLLAYGDVGDDPITCTATEVGTDQECTISGSVGTIAEVSIFALDNTDDFVLDCSIV